MKPYILIIDDKFEKNNLNSELLSKYDFTIIQDSAIAIEEVTNNVGKYALILLDHDFPRQRYEGWAVLDMIKTKDVQTPIVGFSVEWEKNKDCYSGLENYLLEWGDKEKILNKIDDYLRRRENKKSSFNLQRNQSSV